MKEYSPVFIYTRISPQAEVESLRPFYVTALYLTS